MKTKRPALTLQGLHRDALLRLVSFIPGENISPLETSCKFFYDFINENIEWIPRVKSDKRSVAFYWNSGNKILVNGDTQTRENRTDFIIDDGAYHVVRYDRPNVDIQVDATSSEIALALWRMVLKRLEVHQVELFNLSQKQSLEFLQETPKGMVKKLIFQSPLRMRPEPVYKILEAVGGVEYLDLGQLKVEMTVRGGPMKFPPLPCLEGVVSVIPMKERHKRNRPRRLPQGFTDEWMLKAKNLKNFIGMTAMTTMGVKKMIADWKKGKREIGKYEVYLRINSKRRTQRRRTSPLKEIHECVPECSSPTSRKGHVITRQIDDMRLSLRIFASFSSTWKVVLRKLSPLRNVAFMEE